MESLRRAFGITREHAEEREGEAFDQDLQAKIREQKRADREEEMRQREERRVKTSLRLSGLPTGQTLASFDFAFQPSVERSQIETLATCAWVR